MGKKIRIRIRDEQPVSYFQELRNSFFGFKKYLNSFMRILDPEWKIFVCRIRNIKKFTSGINMLNPQHCITLCLLSGQVLHGAAGV